MPEPSSLVIPAKAGIQAQDGSIDDGRFFVYILASKKNGTLYTGMTSDLAKRGWQHKQGQADGFTKKYNIKNLVYYERHQNAESAILREKQIKE